jgi:hypothetical protein
MSRKIALSLALAAQFGLASLGANAAGRGGALPA